jgi:PAS domain S-box-containing protein
MGTDADQTSDVAALEDRIAELEQQNTELEEEITSLKHSSNLHREALKTAQVGTWRWDLNTDQVHWSDELYNLFHISPDEFDGTVDSFLAHVYEEDRDRVYSEIEKVLNNNKISNEYQVKHRVTTVDGTIRWLHCLGRLIVDSSGIPRQLMGVSYDVTDTVTQNQSNRELQQKYELLAEQSLFGLYILQDSRILFANHKAASMLDYTPDELMGVNFFELLTPEDGHRVKQVMEARSKGQLDIFEYELKLKKRSDDFLPVLIHSGMIRYNGKPAILGTVLDISDRRDAEKILHEKEQRISQIFDQIPAIVWTTDQDLVFTSSAGSGLNQLQSKPGSVIGQSLYEYFNTQDDDFLPIRKHLNALQGQAQRFEIEFRDRYYQTAIDPLTDTEENIIGCIANAVDITELKSIQENLQQTISEKEILLSEMHHRVKNNLALIHAMLELQVRDTDHQQVMEQLDHTKHRVQSIALVHELLYTTEELDQVAMDTYLEKLTDALISDSCWNGKLTPDLEIDTLHLPITYAVPVGLIVNELVNNCLRHAFTDQHSSPKVQLVFSKNDDLYQLQVKDNGIGIADTITINECKSLGLNIVKQLTNQIKGSCELIRKEGTEVSISFNAPPN